MRFIVFFTLFVVSTSYAHVQDTIWFDENWIETQKSKANYFRPSPDKINEGYLFVDYYLNGNVQMKGVSLKPLDEFYHGTVLWYYEDGAIFQIVNYDHGKLQGKRTVYYNEGYAKNIRHYHQGYLEGVWSSYHSNGKLKEKGFYAGGEKHGIWELYDSQGRLIEEGEYDNGKKSGIWKTHHPDEETEELIEF